MIEAVPGDATAPGDVVGRDLPAHDDLAPDIAVITAADAAIAALDPLRRRILTVLAIPGSATTVAAALGTTRQKVNYHLRELERHGLVRLVEERPRRGLTERIVVATARSFVISPDALGDIAASPERTDRLSSRYLVALAGRMVREVAELARRAERSDVPLATLSIDTEIRFASAAQRAAFTEDLAGAVTALVARYHDEAASGGRWHRLVVAAHPLLYPPDPTSRHPPDPTLRRPPDPTLRGRRR